MENETVFKANRESTERLRRIITRLPESEYSEMIGNEWTISITLAHIALWDQRALFVLESALLNNKVHAPFYDDQLNDVLTPILGAIPFRKAADLAITTAERFDRKLEKCPPAIMEEMTGINSRLVERYLHRNLHLDDVERALKK